MEKELKERTLVQTTLKIIQDFLKSGIDGVYLVGSLASGESTVLDEKTCVSDVDIIIDVGCITFLKLQLLGLRGLLSDRLRVALGSKVSIRVTSSKLSRYFRSIRPNTFYIYELTPIALDEKKFSIPQYGQHAPPNRSDSLKLAFSSIADYLFLQSGLLGDIKEDEKSYIVAKRCLTLLNSFLSFKGQPSRSYLGRLKLAAKHYPDFGAVLGIEDIRVFQVLTDLKLSGDCEVLKRLSLNRTNSAPAFLNSYFKKLSLRLLVDMLADYTSSYPAFRALNEDAFYVLLDKYKSHARVSFINVLFYAISQVGLFIKDRNREKLKVAMYSAFSERLKAGDLIRLLIGRAYVKSIHNEENLTKENIVDLKMLWDMFTT